MMLVIFFTGGPSNHKCSGMEGDSSQSVTAWGINVGSRLASGVSKIYANIFAGGSTGSSFSSSPRSPPKAPFTGGSGPGSGLGTAGESAMHGDMGVVTIIDTVSVNSSGGNADADGGSGDAAKSDGLVVVAHFVAHTKAVVALQWDPSGSLLLTADKPGHVFNVFRVVAHPLGSACAAVPHLYTLYRGDTPGSVQDIAFSPDSR